MPHKSEDKDSHYEYPYSHQEIDINGYLSPMVLNTDNLNYATIKENDATIVANFNDDDDDNGDNSNYLELTEH